jgi:cation diffusion facilitator CzcD-associated flavoprotein CzcO
LTARGADRRTEIARWDTLATVAEVETDTTIVGASAAGLAAAACLARAGVPYVLLEEKDVVASAWRRHYDRLHLHTSKGFSALPYLRWPRATPRYPSRDEVVAYLERYAAHFEIAPRFGERVRAIRREGAGWQTRTDGALVRSKRVVIATGYTRTPFAPSWPGQDTFGGPIVHSSGYANGAAWRGKRVLVVGFGNSGGEIAIDLCEHGAKPTLAVRGAVNVLPRDFLRIPILAWGIALSILPARVGDAIARLVARISVGRLETLGLRRLPYGCMTQVRAHGRIPLLDIGTTARIRRGDIEVAPGVESFGPGTVRFADDTLRSFDAVVLATGYRPALAEFLDAPDTLDDSGVPRASGAETLPGLYFCGFYVAPTGMFREIARDAKRIARAITRKT